MKVFKLRFLCGGADVGRGRVMGGFADLKKKRTRPLKGRISTATEHSFFRRRGVPLVTEEVNQPVMSVSVMLL